MKEAYKAKNKLMRIKIISSEEGYSYLLRYLEDKISNVAICQEPAVEFDTDIQKFKCILKDLPKVCLKTGALSVKGVLFTDEKNQTTFKYCIDADGIFVAETTTTSQEKLLC